MRLSKDNNKSNKRHWISVSKNEDETPAESIPNISPEPISNDAEHPDVKALLDNITPEQMTTLLNLAKEWPKLVTTMVSTPSVVTTPATPALPTVLGNDAMPPPSVAVDNPELLLSARCSMFQRNEELLADFGGRMNTDILCRVKILQQYVRKQSRMVQAVSTSCLTVFLVLEQH